MRVPAQHHECLISFVVIGKNEARHLGRCARSIRNVAGAEPRIETIYVDSASTDDSVAIATAEFDTVLVLKPSAHLNAGAARRVGTEFAKGSWIVFLDGDMELLDGCWPILRKLIATGNPVSGVCGQTLNVYDDGTSGVIHLPRNSPGKPCRDFGGAVILPREALINAGNWSARLYAYEETELLARLSRDEVSIEWIPVPVVKHYTERFRKLRRIRGNLWPRGSHLGKKFFGAGQLLWEIAHQRTFPQFLKIRPEVALILAGIAAGGALALFRPALGALTFLTAWTIAASVRGLRSAVQHTLWLPQVLFGLFRYPKGFNPQVDRILQRPFSGPDAG